jgi:V/A-type H+-transporting ATPase subunit I
MDSPPPDPLPPDFEAELATVATEAAREQAGMEALKDSAAALKNRIKTLSPFPVRHIPLASLRDLRFLHLAMGTLPQAAVPQALSQLEPLAVVNQIGPGSAAAVPLVITALREHRFEIESLLESLGFVSLELPEGDGTVEEEIAHARKKLAEISVERHDRRQLMGQMATRYGRLIQWKCDLLKDRIAGLRAQSHFGQTLRSFCLTGWIPENRTTDARRIIARAAGESAIVTVTPAAPGPGGTDGRAQVPVKLSSHPLLKPFQAMVTAYGTPRYEEIDPSLFVAATVVIMFGIMFGDVGHGALLLLAGLGLLRSRHPKLQSMKVAAPLFLFCGASATLAGFAYGSVFGREGLLPALWLQPLEKTTTLFACAIGFGVACISIALLFNIINRFRAREYAHALFDKNGLTGILLYWGALALGGLAIAGHPVAPLAWAGVVGLPLLVLLLHEPLHLVYARRQGRPATALSIAWLTAAIETADTVSSLFSNTISFVRVGAFALSHAALCLAVYAIAEMLHGVLGGSWLSWTIIVLGNLFVIGLEALLVLIQITRLEYYELFAKYFKGDGLPYAPFKLEPMNTQGETRTCPTHAH